jgi:hypothetical protein
MNHSSFLAENKTLLSWLLEAENPPVRYRTLTGLLDRPEDDPEVRETKAAIPAYPPVAALLAAQKPTGYWIQRDYYLPKNYSTFCVLSILADLGLTKGNEHIRRGCAYLFTHQREDGQFCRRRRMQGQGVVWETRAEPCTHARVVRFLIQFGYGDDPRTRSAIGWLLATQRDDAMWLCSWARGRGCLRATLDFLRVAALDPATAAQPATARAAVVIYGLLMEPNMGRYHVGDGWTILVYPYFGYGLIPALEAIARLGYTADHPRIAAAVDYLLRRRQPDGSWPLDERVSRPPLDFGQPSEPNKWLTLDTLRTLKQLGCLDVSM